jgi:tetratricopeptide (TPR) repeat protein
LIEFLKTKEKGYINERLYFDISDCYGKLGEEKKGLAILEEAFGQLTKTKDLYDNLGWMYFKVHNTKKGIVIIQEGLKKFPNSSDLLMTLGTLYSDIWDYENAKKNYLLAINNSIVESKSNNFRSIAYYNLSILENSFLYYQEAFNSAKAAISLKDRSSPHLELNYLFIQSLDLQNSYDELLKASSLEPKTLFPEMSIAYAYIMAGKIDEAIRLINELLQTSDFSWMLYFGTNKDSYNAELYKNLALAYEFKANQINYNEINNFSNTISRPFRNIYYNILSLFYNLRLANINIKIGEQLIKGGSEIEGLHQLFDAYEKIWASKAYKLILLNESIEKKLNPRKQKYFDFKKTVLRKKTNFLFSDEQNSKRIIEIIKVFDTKWEKDLIVSAKIELIKSVSSEEKEKLIEDLFILHPPLIPMNNLKLGINFRFSDNVYDTEKIIKIFQHRGFKIVKNSRIIIEVDNNEKKYFINIYDKNILLKSFYYELNKKNDFDKFGVELFKKVFITELK